jgi:hypothetical protein
MSSFEVFGSVVPRMRWREPAKGHEFLTKVTRLGKFPPSVKKRKTFEVEFDVPTGSLPITREWLKFRRESTILKTVDFNKGFRPLSGQMHQATIFKVWRLTVEKTANGSHAMLRSCHEAASL